MNTFRSTVNGKFSRKQCENKVIFEDKQTTTTTKKKQKQFNRSIFQFVKPFACCPLQSNIIQSMFGPCGIRIAVEICYMLFFYARTYYVHPCVSIHFSNQCEYGCLLFQFGFSVVRS